MKWINQATDDGAEMGLDLGQFGKLTLNLKNPPVEPTFRRFSVTSSNIDNVAYASGDQLLRVTFHSGEEYEYEGVSFDTLRELLHAESVGRYFNQNIKTKYTCRHLEDV